MVLPHVYPSFHIDNFDRGAYPYKDGKRNAGNQMKNIQLIACSILFSSVSCMPFVPTMNRCFALARSNHTAATHNEECSDTGQYEECKKLHEAVAAGDVSRVTQHLQAGISPDCEYNKQPPLVIAARHAHHAVAQQLLEAGACTWKEGFAMLNDRTEWLTPLWMAIIMGDCTMVALLLQHKAFAGQTLRAPSTFQYPWITPLEYAIMYNLYDIAELLVTASNLPHFTLIYALNYAKELERHTIAAIIDKQLNQSEFDAINKESALPNVLLNKSNPITQIHSGGPTIHHTRFIELSLALSRVERNKHRRTRRINSF